MAIDIIVFSILVFSIFKGFRKGLILALFSFLAFFAGLAAALKLSAVVANRLEAGTNISQRWLPVLAFFLVFLLVLFLVRLGAKALETVVQGLMLGWLNRIGGVLLYALVYLFIFSVFLFYVQKLNLIKPQTIQSSSTYSFIQPLAPALMNSLGKILPWFKDLFRQLEVFFGCLAAKR